MVDPSLFRGDWWRKTPRRRHAPENIREGLCSPSVNFIHNRLVPQTRSRGEPSRPLLKQSGDKEFLTHFCCAALTCPPTRLPPILEGAGHSKSHEFGFLSELVRPLKLGGCSLI